MTMLGYRLSAEVLGSAILPLLAGYLIRQAIAQVYSDLKQPFGYLALLVLLLMVVWLKQKSTFNDQITFLSLVRWFGCESSE